MQKDAKRSLPVRCAIYTRKSVSEGLQQEFNTLDAQREAAEAYIASQQQQGWLSLPERYDDGGFTGANSERPALGRLLADVEAGRIDCVVVYKVDRLSRSLLDFARMMALFEQHEVSFVSVTQQFNTTQSMGRLTLNILLSFAQFEREIISERTRDKMAAARRKGKWLGGTPVFGYDVHPANRRLIVNHDEAEQVRAIFGLYLKSGGLIPTVEELHKRGWNNKRSLTRKGTVRGGRPFTKTSLHALLTNVTYRGKTKYNGKVYSGEQEAIVSFDLFRRAQRQLRENRHQKRRKKADTSYGLLAGLIYCAACQAPMVHTYTSRGSRRYRYYVCSSAQKRGWNGCPTGSIPATEIEGFVIGEVQSKRQNGGAGLPAWDSLGRLQQAEALAQLIRRVEYDGRNGDLSIELAGQQSEAAT